MVNTLRSSFIDIRKHPRNSRSTRKRSRTMEPPRSHKPLRPPSLASMKIWNLMNKRTKN